MDVPCSDIDSSRADRLGVYGHEVPAPPDLDRFAEGTAVFDRSDVACSPFPLSRAGYVSGHPVVDNGIVMHGSQAQAYWWWNTGR